MSLAGLFLNGSTRAKAYVAARLRLVQGRMAALPLQLIMVLAFVPSAPMVLAFVPRAPLIMVLAFVPSAPAARCSLQA